MLLVYVLVFCVPLAAAVPPPRSAPDSVSLDVLRPDMIDEIADRLSGADLVRFGCTSRYIYGQTRGLARWCRLFGDANCIDDDLLASIHRLVLDLYGVTAPVRDFERHLADLVDGNEHADRRLKSRARRYASCRTLEQALNVGDRVVRSYCRDSDDTDQARARRFHMLDLLVRHVRPDLFSIVIPTLDELFGLTCMRERWNVEMWPWTGTRPPPHVISALIALCIPHHHHDDGDHLHEHLLQTVISEASTMNVKYADPSAPEMFKGGSIPKAGMFGLQPDLIGAVRSLYADPWNTVFPHNNRIAVRLLQQHPDLLVDVGTVRALLRFGIRFRLDDYVTCVLDRRGLPDAVLDEILPYLDGRDYFDDIREMSHARYFWVNQHGQFLPLFRRLPLLLGREQFRAWVPMRQQPDFVARLFVSMLYFNEWADPMYEVLQLPFLASTEFAPFVSRMLVRVRGMGRHFRGRYAPTLIRLVNTHLQTTDPAAYSTDIAALCQGYEWDVRAFLCLPELYELPRDGRDTLLDVILKNCLDLVARFFDHQDCHEWAKSNIAVVSPYWNHLLNTGYSHILRRLPASVFALRDDPEIHTIDQIVSDPALALKFLCRPDFYTAEGREHRPAFFVLFCALATSTDLLHRNEFTSFVPEHRSLIFPYLVMLAQIGQVDDVFTRLTRYPFMVQILKERDANGSTLLDIARDSGQSEIYRCLKNLCAWNPTLWGNLFYSK